MKASELLVNALNHLELHGWVPNGDASEYDAPCCVLQAICWSYTGDGSIFNPGYFEVSDRAVGAIRELIAGEVSTWNDSQSSLEPIRATILQAIANLRDKGD